MGERYLREQPVFGLGAPMGAREVAAAHVAVHAGIDDFLHVLASNAAERKIESLLVRGDHELNEVKAGKIDGMKGFRFATESEIVEHFGCEPGYLGPLGTTRPVRVIADRTVPT